MLDYMKIGAMMILIYSVCPPAIIKVTTDMFHAPSPCRLCTFLDSKDMVTESTAGLQGQKMSPKMTDTVVDPFFKRFRMKS
jgi:hypothetical protein